jgi:hypothetical protein
MSEPDKSEPEVEGAARPAGDLPPDGESLRVRFSDPNADSLDMLVTLNEPELLMRALHRLAGERTSRSWGVVARYAGIAEEALKAANEPPVNRPTE